MVTSLSKIFRIKRRVSWRRDGKEGVKRGVGQKRRERRSEVCDGSDGERKGGKKYAVARHICLASKSWKAP